MRVEECFHEREVSLDGAVEVARLHARSPLGCAARRVAEPKRRAADIGSAVCDVLERLARAFRRCSCTVSTMYAGSFRLPRCDCGVRCTGRRSRLPSSEVSGIAAGDCAGLLGVRVGDCAGNRDQEAELDVALGQRDITGEAMHHAERTVRPAWWSMTRACSAMILVRGLVCVAGVDDDREFEARERGRVARGKRCAATSGGERLR